MGHDFDLTPEENESLRRKKMLLKADVSYKLGDDVEFPDLNNTFIPGEIKKKVRDRSFSVDLKKSKRKNKSNKLL